MKRLAIDFEFASRLWWESGGQDLWDALTEGFDGGGIIVDGDLADSWIERASQIAGWHDGPEYAPHPIRCVDVDPEEELDL